jgi:hypothetical protein
VERGSLFCGCNAVIEAEMRRILVMMLRNSAPDWSRTQNPMLEKILISREQVSRRIRPYEIMQFPSLYARVAKIGGRWSRSFWRFRVLGYMFALNNTLQYCTLYYSTQSWKSLPFLGQEDAAFWGMERQVEADASSHSRVSRFEKRPAPLSRGV